MTQAPSTFEKALVFLFSSATIALMFIGVLGYGDVPDLYVIGGFILIASLLGLGNIFMQVLGGGGINISLSDDSEE